MEWHTSLTYSIHPLCQDGISRFHGKMQIFKAIFCASNGLCFAHFLACPFFLDIGTSLRTAAAAEPQPVDSNGSGLAPSLSWSVLPIALGHIRPSQLVPHPI